VSTICYTNLILGHCPKSVGTAFHRRPRSSATCGGDWMW
jgi:hypothetical protein